MNFKNIFKLKGKALAEDKRKDFKNIVILQILMIISAVLLKDMLSLCQACTKESSNIIRDCLFLSLAAFYVLILWDLLKDFTQNKRLIYSLLMFIFGTFGLALVIVNPFYQLLEENEARPYLFFIHSALFIVEAMVIVYAIFDIFSGNKLSQEKLWGSACIYLMIALCFGSAFDLVCIAHPGSLGEEMHLGMESYTHCISYSMSILGGQDPPFEHASSLIKNLGIIEAVWGNLFVVLLVGRLLGQPDRVPEQQ